MSAGPFTGTGELVRLALRRDRLVIPLWVAALTLLTAVTVVAFVGLYPTVESRAQFAATVVNNPALLAFTGPAFDLLTIGGLAAWRISAFASVLVALLNVLTVTRHTRAEEEGGRLELLGSTVVGRRAPLTAALLVAAVADVAVGVGMAVPLVAYGESPASAVALGAGYAAVGLVFAGVAAVAAQLTDGARAANGIAGGTVAVAFLLRAVGDASGSSGPGWLSWIAPLSWAAQVRPYAGDRWAVLGLAGAVAAAHIAVAYVLVGRRDLGAGILPVRSGPPVAPPSLRGTFALAWRLQRGTLALWALGFAAFGVALGLVADSVTGLVDSSPQIRQIIEARGLQGDIVDGYLASTLSIVGIVAAAFAVQSTLRLRAEETGLRAEPVLAGAVPRIRWAASHVVVAVAGATGLLLVQGTALGIVRGARAGDLAGQFPRMVGGALVHVPTAVLLAGLALALFGLAPHWVSAAWGVLVAWLLLTQIGTMLQLPGWVLDLSPFTHIPLAPAVAISALPLVVLTAIGAALGAAGFAGFQRRDVG